MIKLQSLLFILFFLSASLLKGQDVNQILLENRWSVYDNFAIIDFFPDGQAELEYAYCSYCKTNKDTVAWELLDKMLLIGEDTLKIHSASSNEIKTNQYSQLFIFKNIEKLKETKLNKVEIQQFLVTDKPLNIKVKSPQFNNSIKQPIQFAENGKMWLDNPKFKGQWAIKSFYGDLFLIYLHRKAVNRKFPLLKVKELKKGKFVGQPIPSVKNGCPFVLVISE